jgi:hypothetical protein
MITILLILNLIASTFFGNPKKEFADHKFGDSKDNIRKILVKVMVEPKEVKGNLEGITSLKYETEGNGLYFSTVLTFRNEKLNGGFLMISGCPMKAGLDTATILRAHHTRDSLFNILRPELIKAMGKEKPVRTDSDQLIYQLKPNKNDYRFITLERSNLGIPSITYQNFITPRRYYDSLEAAEQDKIKNGK